VSFARGRSAAAGLERRDHGQLADPALALAHAANAVHRDGGGTVTSDIAAFPFWRCARMPRLLRTGLRGPPPADCGPSPRSVVWCSCPPSSWPNPCGPPHRACAASGVAAAPTVTGTTAPATPAPRHRAAANSPVLPVTGTAVWAEIGLAAPPARPVRHCVRVVNDNAGIVARPVSVATGRTPRPGSGPWRYRARAPGAPRSGAALLAWLCLRAAGRCGHTSL
jgi:hypothetical protein